MPRKNTGTEFSADDSKNLPPIDLEMFSIDGAKFPSEVDLSKVNSETITMLLQVIDDFEQANLAGEESDKYRAGSPISLYYKKLKNALNINASYAIGGVLNLNQRDESGIVPLQLIAWRNELRSNGGVWRDRIHQIAIDKARANNQAHVELVTPVAVEYDNRPYHGLPSSGHAAAGDYNH